MPYDPRLVQPMREELTSIGVQELRTAGDVADFMAETAGTTLVIINSVCGCAAGSARPGVAHALRHDVRPDRIATVFAGQDTEATAAFRNEIPDVPPSSPSMALFKDGKLVHFLPRHMIEGRDAAGVATQLTASFDEHCGSGSRA